LGFREIFYRDEVFTLDKKRVFQICDRIMQAKITMAWICSVKANTASFDLLQAMKNAGCRLIRIGVESGVQEILNSVKKDVKISQVEDVFRWARALNLETHAHMMLGMPGETEKTVQATFDFVKKIKPSTITYGIMTPYPGTEIYSQVVAKDPGFGDGTRINAQSIHTNASFSKIFSRIEEKKLEQYVQEGYRRFYMRPTYILERIMKVRDWQELKRLVLAGTQVFRFIMQGDQ